MKKSKLIRKFKAGLLLTLIIWCFSPSYAQKLNSRFSHFTTMNGLSQSSVYAIEQDQYGFMWFGTRSGLNKFDGYNFTVFKHNRDDSHSISGNEVISLLEDSKGRLWVGTREDGLNLYDEETETFKSYEFKKTDNAQKTILTVNDIYETVDGRLIFATYDGLCYWDENNDQIRSVKDEVLRDTNIKSISKSSVKGTVWIGTKKGGFLFDFINEQVIRSFVNEPNNSSSISDDYVTSILEDSRGMVWIGTYKNGLNLLLDAERGTFRRLQHDADVKTSLTSNVIRTIHEDVQGDIWLGTKVALEKLTLKEQAKPNPSFIHYMKDASDDFSMNQNSVYSFFEDENRDFWIGTYNGGVNYLYNGVWKFEYFKHQLFNPKSISNNEVSSFAIDSSGVWVGTDGGGLNFWDTTQDEFKFYGGSNQAKGLKNNNIKSLKIDSEGVLWVGTYKGLYKYDRVLGEFEVYFENEEILTLEEGVENELWIGTGYDLKVFNTVTEEVIHFERVRSDTTSISNISIKKIFKSNTGELWIGTKLGLNLYDREKNKFQRYLSDERDKGTLSHSYITSMAEDDEGNLWVGTFNGLSKFDRETQQFTQMSVIPNSMILNIVFDDNGILWLTTNKELVKCDPDKLGNEFVQRIYTADDGLQHGEFRIGASCKLPNGKLLFGGVQGVNRFDPNNLKDNLKAPHVVLTSFKLFNRLVEVGGENSPLKKQIHSTKEITLNYKQSVFEIGFVAINYVASSKNSYAFKLEGFQDEWNYVGDRRSAYYTGLPAGSYTFRVKASNNDGVWNEEGASVKLVILPPWWGTWWFRGTIVLTFILIVWLIFHFRVRILKSQKQQLMGKVEERTSDLMNANSELEFKQVEILKQKEELEAAFDQLKEAQSQLVQVEKMASIGVLTSGVAHEINNPLNFIQASNDYLKKYVESNLQSHKSDLTPCLDAIQTGLDRTGLILANLNRFNKRNTNYDEECLVHTIIDGCLAILQPQFRNRIEVKCNYTAKNDLVIGNQGEFHQLMLNVLSNAGQAMHESGILIIETHLSKHSFEITVSDTGYGISEKNISKVIDPFFTTKEPGEGVGLGLSIAFSIVKKHNGMFNIDSKLGEGTVVRLTFPIK